MTWTAPKSIAISVMLHGALAVGFVYVCRPLASSYGQYGVIKIRLLNTTTQDSPITNNRPHLNPEQQRLDRKLSLRAAAPRPMSTHSFDNVLSDGPTVEHQGQPPLLVRDSVQEPNFTSDAIRVGFRGLLILDLNLDEFGKVISATLRNPSGLKIDEEAVTSASTARYLPARDETGRPVASTAELRFEFLGH